MHHIEDLIIHEGGPGALRTLGILKRINQSETDVHVKWDGAPAVVFGLHPISRMFFVGTKAVYSKTTPKFCFTNEDVDKFYARVPDLADKLKLCLKELPDVFFKNYKNGDHIIMIGDFLFGEHIKGNYFTYHDTFKFTPNTVTYERQNWTQLNEARMGIAIHSLLSTLDPKETPSIPHRLIPTKGTIVFETLLNPSVPPFGFPRHDLFQELNDILGEIDSEFLKKLETTTVMSSDLYGFLNYEAHNGKCVRINRYDDFIVFLQRKFDTYASKRNMPGRGERYLPKVAKDKRNIELLFKFIYKVTDIKLALMADLQMKCDTKCSIVNVTGRRVTTHEGFVANGVKLVNRDVFTFHNYQINKRRKEIQNNGR